MNVRDFNVKTSSPDEDRLETVLHFVGDTFPRVFVINRLDREVDYVEVGGQRYERVRECEWKLKHGGTLYDKWCCSECGFQFVEPRCDQGYTDLEPNYCPNCGAKVVSADD